MANQFATTLWVVKEAGFRFLSAARGIPAMSRKYDAQFEASGGSPKGRTILVPLPFRATVRTGEGAVIQSMTDRTTPVTLSDQTGADFDYSSAQKATEMTMVREKYVNPAVDAIAADANRKALERVYYHFWSAVGTPGTAPSANATWFDIGGKLFDIAGLEDDLTVLAATRSMAALVNTNTTIFQPAGQIGQQWKSGLMAQGALGFKEWYRENAAPKHTTGSFTSSTPIVDSASQTGSSITSTGWASGATALKKGDIIEFAGVYSINMLSRASTGRLAQFTLTADVSDSTGSVTLPISPPIITSGPLQNVTNSPAANAPVYVWNTRSTTYAQTATVTEQSLVLHKSAAAFVTVDLPKLAGVDTERISSSEFNLAMRFSADGDIMHDRNISRIDMLWGVAPLNKECGGRVAG